MINKKIFFDEYKRNLDPNRSLDAKEISAIDTFIDFVDSSVCKLELNQWAYVFATTFHETKATFLPVREAFYLQERYNWTEAQFTAWRKKNLRYFPWDGKGFVQLTWEDNYKKFAKILGIELIKFPELAMIPKYAFEIMVYGFIHGSFTGKKITDYINGSKKDYKGARRCINGTDKAELIATYANKFENALTKSFIR